MEFELKNLEILENSPTDFRSEDFRPENAKNEAHQQVKKQSLILQEIQKENEQLQDKLKLNYRRLLLFEAENNKLIEEKNKHFFEARTHIEKANLLEERNHELEQENALFSNTRQLLSEKIITLEKINQTQLSEIKKFARFHLKIQNVVKPYIVQLKNQLAILKKDLDSTKSELSMFKSLNQDLEHKYSELAERRQNEEKIYQIDKNAITKDYEEQIHTFSKEILEQQQKNEQLRNEVSRLKKSLEFKNYFENEVIKFKRIHEEDQFNMGNLQQKNNELNTESLMLNEQLVQMKIEVSRFKSHLEEKESLLEITRTQLAKQIENTTALNERLHRLEVLNNQLSREISQPS